MKPEENPFYSGSYCGQPFFCHSVEDRLDRVKEFTVDECKRALEVLGLQKTVETAIKRRLKKLEKQDEPSAV